MTAEGRTDLSVANPIVLAAESVRATRRADSAAYREALASLHPRTLARALDGADARFAFWLNVYNASVKDNLQRDPSLFEKRGFLPRRSIFITDLLTIPGESLSVDDVEHGILRRSQQPWGLGYVPRFRPSAFERQHRVDEVDERIHFALNCGASSCPPILAYDAEDLHAQLDAVTAGYLQNEVEYDENKDVARVPRLFSWYRGDFGGKSGIREFLREHDAIPDDATPRLSWQFYDWSLKLGQYADPDGTRH